MKMKNIFKFKNIKIENQKSKSKSEYFDHLSEEDVELIRTWRNNQKGFFVKIEISLRSIK